MSALGSIDGVKVPLEFEGWTFDEDDLTLIALLRDAPYGAEVLWEDPQNRDYGGCYRVRDYQYPLWRHENPYEGYACARSVGKTESIKGRSQRHVFKRVGSNLLLTAPELIHLLPLTDSIEDKLRSVRLTRELLDTRNQGTGFQHRPFQVNFVDGTKIVGRIPKLTGTGVKGQHQPDLLVDEAQDYPDKGWIELHETVMKDTVDRDGNPDFMYHFYGVHTGDRSSSFYRLASDGSFKITNVTAIQRPGWGKSEKNAAKAMYGGTSSSDYRRNILGEPGGASSPLFVLARLMSCVDQGKDGDPMQSGYNVEHEQRGKPVYRSEEVDQLGIDMGDLLDLPRGYKAIHIGADLGLTQSPTVITIFAHTVVNRKPRLKLLRRITLERFRTKDIRQVFYAIAWHFGPALKSFGVDQTGLGFPIFQEMEDDEACPTHLKEIMRGYFFNAKVEVGVQKEFLSEDSQGNLRDQYGQEVKIVEDPLTGVRRYITYQTMIEASTRYLREFVDSMFFLMPFDVELVRDMQGETPQRVKHIAGLKKKPNAFHILDSMRAMAMAFKAEDIEEALDASRDEQVPVLDMTMEEGGPAAALQQPASPGGAVLDMTI